MLPKMVFITALSYMAKKFVGTPERPTRYHALGAVKIVNTNARLFSLGNGMTTGYPPLLHYAEKVIDLIFIAAQTDNNHHTEYLLP
jgi:hypothetical protein